MADNEESSATATDSTTSSGPLSGPAAAQGPLVVSAANPRYFTVASGHPAERRVVYLTGSHVNNNFHDGLGFGAACPETPERFGFRAPDPAAGPAVLHLKRV